jgi:hypothetical protein
MIMTVMMILVALAFLFAVLSIAGYTPLWISVLFLCIIELLRVLPAK